MPLISLEVAAEAGATVEADRRLAATITDLSIINFPAKTAA
jgi:hypothetical protein